MTKTDLDAIRERVANSCAAIPGDAESALDAAETDLRALLSEVGRLRKALKGARRSHVGGGDLCPRSESNEKIANAPCECGADAHNAKIDAALRGDA